MAQGRPVVRMLALIRDINDSSVGVRVLHASLLSNWGAWESAFNDSRPSICAVTR